MVDDEELVDAPVMQSLNPFPSDASPMEPDSDNALEANPTTTAHSPQLEGAVETTMIPLRQIPEELTAEHVNVYEQASPGQLSEFIRETVESLVSLNAETVELLVSATMRSTVVMSKLPVTEVASGSSSEVPSAASIVPIPVVLSPFRLPEGSSFTFFHGGVSCDVCQMLPIEGTRFKSTRKHDYDLCSNCFKEADDQADYIHIHAPLIKFLEANETNNRKCREILEGLRFNKVVRDVYLDNNKYFGSAESCKVLGEVVGSSKTLSNLSLRGVGLDGDGLECIIRGLLSNPNSDLVRLDIGSNFVGKKGADLVEELLLSNLPKLTILGILDSAFSAEGMARVGRGLAKNKTLLSFECGGAYIPAREGRLSSILRALTPVEKLTPEQALYQDGKYNQTLQTLNLEHEYGKGVAESLVQMLTCNASLKFLGLKSFWFNREDWGEVWKALKHNKVVETLDLYRSGGGLGDAFEDLMELLQANRTLKKIQMRGTPLEASGQSALVKQKLERNARLADYLGTLNKRLKFEPPKIGRLFLCGYPRAGKTTLRRSMVGTQGNMIIRTLFSGAACMAKHPCFFPSFFDKRTQGIEIRMLKDSGDKHIAVWDMAGQDEYHALHDSHYMFPNINQACLFLFLFRPELDKNGKWQEEHAIKCLEKELCYWLAFINSNSRKTGWVLPQVSVVLTHLDKLSLRFPGRDEKTRARSYVNWASEKVNKLRDDFKGRVELQTTVHAVDAFSAKHARRVVDDVFKRFDLLFRSTLPEVPAACEEMNLFLAKWTVRHSSSPIITREAFFDLCKQNVRELNALFQEVPPELANEAQSFRQKNELAVASYLHDVGSIIHIPKSTFVVLDPNWLGKVFLGQLFRPGDGSYEPIIPSTKNGCISRGNLENALNHFIQSKDYHGFTSEDLIKLMKELELCYEETLENEPPTYFIPSTLSDSRDLARQGQRKLEWMVQGAEQPIYHGLRLQCTDQAREFLSPGFFQRFQVHLQTFSRGRNVEYKIEKNLIRLMHDGLELLVEKSGDNGLLDGGYLDILAKSYSPALNGWHDLYRSVVEELRNFCASGEGCPGVALQEAILRPGCVERLTLCCYRKDQAVVKETLKQRVIDKILKSSDLWNDDSYENSISETSQIYKHSFPAVPHDPSLPAVWIEAMRMLNLMDVKEAIFKYRTTIIQQRYGISQAVDEIQSVAGSVTSDPSTASNQPERLDGPPDGPNNWIYYQNEIERRNQDPPAIELRDVETLRDAATCIIGRIDNAASNIISRIDQLELNLPRHVKESLKDMQMHQQMLQSTLVEKLDQVMGITAELQDIPGMPYFLHKVGLTQHLVASIQIGQALKLHFMCENPSQPHYIIDQKGLPLVNLIQGDFYKKLRPLILGSIKILFILVKAGLHVGAGIGSAIPDFTALSGIEPITTFTLGGETLMDSIKGISSENIDVTLADAWECVQTKEDICKWNIYLFMTSATSNVKYCMECTDCYGTHQGERRNSEIIPASSSAIQICEALPLSPEKALFLGMRKL